MTAERSKRLFTTGERLLLAAGMGCLLWYGAVAFEARLYQTVEQIALDRMLAAGPLSLGVAAGQPDTGDLIGRLEVPRVHLSVIVVNGDDDGTLRAAVGHLPDTPFPWQAGNSAFAGHRDGLFRPLENIRPDDEIRVVTPQGTYRYEVRRTLIVKPEDVWVLAPSRQTTLTLVTCYPFHYVGPAPQRFIVQAERVGVQPAD